MGSGGSLAGGVEVGGGGGGGDCGGGCLSVSFCFLVNSGDCFWCGLILV